MKFSGSGFYFLFFLVFILIRTVSVNGAANDQLCRKTVITWNDTVPMYFLSDSAFYKQGWDTLAQVRFWREVINLTSDTCIINVASCRKPVDKVSRKIWMQQNEFEKVCFKDSLCNVHCLEPGTNLFVTAGKGEFYEVKKTLSLISAAIETFESVGCDPW